VKLHDGVVMVNFFSGFVVPDAAARYMDRVGRERELRKTIKDPEKLQAELRRTDPKGPMTRGTIHDLIDHIDHIVQVAGIDHVGIGSDFDGVSTLPTQLEDVSCYPYITQALLDRGYSEVDIKKVLGENLLRVMTKVEEVAKQSASTKTSRE
jgi:membrane dipeptidase